MKITSRDSTHADQLAQPDQRAARSDPPLLPRALPRILVPETIPRKPYRKRPNCEKDVKHWGQRKLCLSEIEFLTDHIPHDRDSDRDRGQSEGPYQIIVIYAGAAPGTHITMLVDLFPQVHQWVLIDPARFGLADHPKVEKRREFFTDKLAAELRDRFRGLCVLFISDIRTANWKQMTQKANERQIAQDNSDQMHWCQIMQPDKAMLKFRLPYGDGHTMYLPGEIRFQVWAPPSSTETRLITSCYDPAKLRAYSHLEYEQRLFYFNTEVRMKQHFPHSIKGPGLDFQYDSAAEVLILSRYLIRFDKDLVSRIKAQGLDKAGKEGAIRQRITELSKGLSELIGESDESLAGRLPESARRKL